MIRILVVDDEEAIRYLVKRPLEEAGYVVDEAQDGEEALARLRQEHYDVMLLDVVMPNKGGIEVLMDLSNEQPGLKVILVTGRARVEADPFQNLIDKLGVQTVLEKPIDPETILSTVQQHIS